MRIYCSSFTEGKLRLKEAKWPDHDGSVRLELPQLCSGDSAVVFRGWAQVCHHRFNSRPLPGALLNGPSS